MAFYGKHHIILYSVACGMDQHRPRERFLENTIEPILKKQETSKNVLTTFYSNISIVDNKAVGLNLPTNLDGHFVNNGRSLLCLHTDDSKTFTLYAISSTGHSKKVKEFTTNNFYDSILFSANQNFCLLMEDLKERTRLQRKLCISYIVFNNKSRDIENANSHYLQRNALTLKFNSSFALINQHRYQLSPNSKLLAIIHFTNTQKLLNLVKIVQNQGKNNLSLSHIVQIDLSEHFQWNYLKDVKFNNNEDKILLASSRTVKQDNAVICTLKNYKVYPLEFSHNIKKNNNVTYTIVRDYEYKDILFRTSTCGQIELIKLLDSFQRHIKDFHLRDFNLERQVTCFAVNSSFKKTNLFVGCATGEIYVIDVHQVKLHSKIIMGSESFKIASIYVNWASTEIFALKEANKKERGNVRICYFPKQHVQSLEELAAKTILQNFPMDYLQSLPIPFSLRYLLY